MIRPRRRVDGATLGRWLLPIGAWLVGMVVLYREVLSSGFDKLQGDVGDQRLLVVISEHWFLAAKGDAAWREPSFFFPVRGTLGYTDSVLLYQPLYIPLRLLGLDQFAAFQLTLMALTTIGFVSMLVLLKRFIGVRLSVAVAGAFVFAFANNVVVKIGHGQMSALNLVPLLLLVAAASLRAVDRGRISRAAAFAVVAGVLSALLFFTSFYVAWFSALAGGLVVLALIAVDLPLARGVWARGRAEARASAVAIGAAAAGFVVGIVPFLATYLPVLDSTGGRPFSEVLALSPRAGDLLNLGAHNLAWGWLLEGDPGSQVDVERALALTPLLLLSAVGITALLLLWRHAEVRRLRVRAALALLAVGAALTFVTLRFGDWTPWRVVWGVAPGAKAIRAVDRVQLVVGLLVVVAWALVVDELWRVLQLRAAGARQRWVAGVVIALMLGVVFEQVNSATFVHLDRSSELEQLASVPPAPPGCSSFYVVNPSADAPFYESQIDGMLIAQLVDLPTLNGYSGVAPPGWGLLRPEDPGYQAAVDAWIGSEPVPGSVCAFDLSTRQWADD